MIDLKEIFGAVKEWEDDEENRREREAGYLRKVEASRPSGGRVITMDLVVAGLEYIARHRRTPQEELIDGLLTLGCDFTIEEIKAQLPNKADIRYGDIAAGAYIIVNMRDSEFGRAYGDDMYLSIDDIRSVYHFLRVVTGDNRYTIARLDQS